MEDRIICNCQDVSFKDIREAMKKGALTVDDVMDMTEAGTICGSCVDEIEEILETVCLCKKISMDTVVEAVKNGADTVEKVGQITKAGTGCGGCRPIIEHIIKNNS